MDEAFSRTALLIGEDKLARLSRSRVLVCGVGGVGAYAAEFVARAGVGSVTVVDGDEVSQSNRNRQLLALGSTVGRRKVEVCRERLLDAVPGVEVTAIDSFLTPESAERLLASDRFDFVIDALDSVAVKAALISTCARLNIAAVSSMGAAGRMDVSRIAVAPLKKSCQCALAKAVRTAVRRLGTPGAEEVPVVFSLEPADRRECANFTDAGGGRRAVPGSLSYVVAAFGGRCAQQAIVHLTGK